MDKITSSNVLLVSEGTKANTFRVLLSDGSIWEYNNKTDKWSREPMPTKEELVESFNSQGGKKKVK